MLLQNQSRLVLSGGKEGPMERYLPEGSLWNTEENRAALQNISSLQEAFEQEKVLEARVLICSPQHDLIVDLGGIKGRIPRCEGALGIEEGWTRDIALIARVNKPVCFLITGFENSAEGPVALLSRRAVQQKALACLTSSLRPGDIIDAVVTHLEPFGAFVDIGCGLPSMIPIDAISVSRISHPKDRFFPGQKIRAVVRSVEPDGRVCLSHKELLGTWEENAALFSPGQTVAGIVRSSESYGVFVELTPNLAGLCEPAAGLRPGQQASVFIKNLIPEKMKVKLILIDAFDAGYPAEPLRYFVSGSHIDRWRYSPDSCPKTIRTVFSEP